MRRAPRREFGLGATRTSEGDSGAAGLTVFCTYAAIRCLRRARGPVTGLVVLAGQRRPLVVRRFSPRSWRALFTSESVVREIGLASRNPPPSSGSAGVRSTRAPRSRDESGEEVVDALLLITPPHLFEIEGSFRHRSSSESRAALPGHDSVEGSPPREMHTNSLSVALRALRSAGMFLRTHHAWRRRVLLLVGRTSRTSAEAR